MSELDAVARFTRETIVEPEHIVQARAAAIEIGAQPISAGIGAQLATISAIARATNILEIGTGAGVSGLWLLHGAPSATLTSIDTEPEHLTLARRAFQVANIPSSQSRFITGDAGSVLPRMNERSYDIVLVDGDPEHVISYVEHALMLVKLSGAVLVPRVLNGGRIADPVRRDETTMAYRELVKETQGSSSVIGSLNTLNEGLLQITIPQ